MNPIARTNIIGTVASLDKKKVNDKNLAEFKIDGIGLKINAWGDLAPKVPAPGALVVVEGKIATRSYQVEGKDRYSTEVTMSAIEIIDTKPEAKSAAAADDEFGDELPF